LGSISINIVAFHLKYDMPGIGLAGVIFVLNAILIYTNWDRFKGLFK